MIVTVCGIAALAVYVATRSDDEIKWSSTYILTLLMVMCIAMVWMVPLMVAAKNPDNILSIMYQVRQWIKKGKGNICVPARSPWPWEPSSTADAQMGQGEKPGGGGGGTRRDFAWGFDDGWVQRADAKLKTNILSMKCSKIHCVKIRTKISQQLQLLMRKCHLVIHTFPVSKAFHPYFWLDKETNWIFGSIMISSWSSDKLTLC